MGLGSYICPVNIQSSKSTYRKLRCLLDLYLHETYKCLDSQVREKIRDSIALDAVYVIVHQVGENDLTSKGRCWKCGEDQRCRIPMSTTSRQAWRVRPGLGAGIDPRTGP